MKANVIPLSSAKSRQKDIAYEEALAWIVAMDRGLDPTSQKALQEWVSLSEINRDALLKEAKMWDELNVLANLSVLFPYDGLERKKPKYKYYLAAASVLVIFILGTMVSNMTGMQNPQMNELSQVQNTIASYATLKGNTETINLPDGSKLVLNTDSAVSINFGTEYRNIFLQRGEMHINVKKDAKRPLNVLVGGKLMQAVGTAFSVQYFDHNNIALIVSEGKVMLAEDSILQKQQTITGQFDTSKEAMFLTAGEKVELTSSRRIAKAELSVENVSSTIAKSLTWLDGYLSFTGETLEIVVAQINRYLEHPIVLDGDEIKNIRVIGRFENGKTEQFLKGLQTNFNLSLQQHEDGHLTLAQN
jgi:transmembrane sensor